MLNFSFDLVAISRTGKTHPMGEIIHVGTLIFSYKLFSEH